MRRDPRPLRDGTLAAVAAAVGVTRVARLTGLDRTGVEVASAVRPAGHVLQVTNGKGATFEEAARGAVLEAVELWAAEHARPGAHAAFEDLRSARPDAEVFPPSALDPEGDPSSDALVVGWVDARLLGAGRERPALVPACAVACPPPGSPLQGPAPLRWTSNGMGAHPDRSAALLHALLEAIERDQLARAFPDGLTDAALAERLVDPASVAARAPEAAARVAALEARGLRVHLLDGGGGLGVPVAGALLVDPHGAPVPVSAGYACRPSRDAALSAALLEACQSRATEIHGAREDVLHGDRGGAAPLAARCAAIRPRRRASALASIRAAPPAAAIADVLHRLDRAGLGRAAAVDLPAPAGVHAVKVLVPGLLLSELL